MECPRCNKDFEKEKEMEKHFGTPECNEIQAVRYRQKRIGIEQERLEIEADKRDALGSIRDILIIILIVGMLMIVITQGGGNAIYNGVGNAYNYIYYDLFDVEKRPSIPQYTATQYQPRTECYQSNDEALCYQFEKLTTLMADVLMQNEDAKPQSTTPISHQLIIPKSSEHMCVYDNKLGYNICPVDTNQICKEKGYQGITLDQMNCIGITMSNYINDDGISTEEHKFKSIGIGRFG